MPIFSPQTTATSWWKETNYFSATYKKHRPIIAIALMYRPILTGHGQYKVMPQSKIYNLVKEVLCHYCKCNFFIGVEANLLILLTACNLAARQTYENFLPAEGWVIGWFRSKIIKKGNFCFLVHCSFIISLALDSNLTCKFSLQFLLAIFTCNFYLQILLANFTCKFTCKFSFFKILKKKSKNFGNT